MMLSSGRGSPFRYQTDADNDRQSDGVVVFRSASDANTEKVRKDMKICHVFIQNLVFTDKTKLLLFSF